MWPSHFGPRSLPCSSRQPSRSGLFAPHRAPPNTPMTTRWLLAALHLLALGVGLGAVWARGRALRDARDASGLRRAFYADTWWGVAALLWIGTGRSEEHTSELQSRLHLVCRLLLEKKKKARDKPRIVSSSNGVCV